jgi:hypothetical protein
MKLKHTIAAILEENQDELFCPFCTKPKGAEIDCCDQSGTWFKLTTLTLIPNSLSPKKSLTHRKVYPTKRLTDWKSEFVYTNSMNTNISRTFQNFKQE